MELAEWIEVNREELSATVARVLGHVPRTAGCYCPLSGTEHQHEPTSPLDDDELERWVLNDEGLYLWARRDGVEV